MRKLFTVFSMLIVTSMLLAACAAPAAPAAPAAEAPAAEAPAAEAPAAEAPAAEAPAAEMPAAEGPKSKDPTTFVLAEADVSIDTLDPALAYDTASGELIQNTYETLVFYDGEATDKFVPQLAESWTVSEDGTVWTFKIRQGV
ncbi:MAG TPA: ABC transporter substrate-binding protein, partial [Anaerolineales bacterium]|nr:ABC transporter substrate-binding protein [Anaerolineales bacterium]